MKYALVNGESQEAQPGLKGVCSGCESVVIAKCGPQKINHWSHHKLRDCDTWWENETQWHRDWKSQFPKEHQEVVHRSSTGEIHRADVKTDKGWVLEFQYSAINSSERKIRSEFYGKIVWIVNGVRRKRDLEQFFKALKVVKKLEDKFISRVCDVASDKSALIRDWVNDSVPVIFDFPEMPSIWCLLPRKGEGQGVVLEISRQEFIRMHQVNNNSSLDGFADFIQFYGTTTSAADLIQKVHERDREQARIRQLQADEARRRNPYINRRGSFRF